MSRSPTKRAKGRRPQKRARAAARGRRAPTRRRAPRATRPAPKPAGGVAPTMQPVNAVLSVCDVAAALTFYERAFGFTRRFDLAGPDGKLTHAEMAHGASVIMMGPESSQSLAPVRIGQTAVTMYVYVPDVDRVTAQAAAAGATIVEQSKDQFWGDRTAVVVDPDRHRWMLATFKRLVPPEEMRPPA